MFPTREPRTSEPCGGSGPGGLRGAVARRQPLEPAASAVEDRRRPRGALCRAEGAHGGRHGHARWAGSPSGGGRGGVDPDPLLRRLGDQDQRRPRCPNSIPGMLSYTRREPVGVVGAYVPFNSPFTQFVKKLGAVLATGCTMVVKPADQASLTILRVAELCLEAGLPEGVLNVVTGGPVSGCRPRRASGRGQHRVHRFDHRGPEAGPGGGREPEAVDVGAWAVSRPASSSPTPISAQAVPMAAMMVVRQLGAGLLQRHAWISSSGRCTTRSVEGVAQDGGCVEGGEQPPPRHHARSRHQ